MCNYVGHASCIYVNPPEKAIMNVPQRFDVFLCHNKKDALEVKKIGEQLKQQGLHPWLDEWELTPGFPWQRQLEKQIGDIKSAAVFIGSSGLGPWQEMEIDAFLREFVKRQSPVIPVLLPNAPEKPELPFFLVGNMWVDFRQQEPEPMGRLIWGITGIKPQNEIQIVAPKVDENIFNEEQGVNYTHLEKLLTSKRWKEADLETKNILLTSFAKKTDEKLGAEELRRLDENILIKLDELWMKHSNQKFGFGVQISIWQEIISPKKGWLQKIFSPNKNTSSISSDKDNWYEFGRIVGWYQKNNRTDKEEWVKYENLNFTSDAPKGHFPYFRNWWTSGYAKYDPERFRILMERISKII
jgi:GUN4-like/TIR domain